MNITKFRENKSKLAEGAIAEIVNGFERALIWQNEDLDNVDGLALTYEANAKGVHIVMIFLATVYSSNRATRQLIEHGLSQTGHDLALQMLGHGVGFFEQDSTNALNDILDYLLDMKAIIPFQYFYDVDQNKLSWDGI